MDTNPRRDRWQSGRKAAEVLLRRCYIAVQEDDIFPLGHLDAAVARGGATAAARSRENSESQLPCRVATHNFLRRVRGGLDTNQALPRREGLPDDRIQAFTHIRRDLAAGNDDGEEWFQSESMKKVLGNCGNWLTTWWLVVYYMYFQRHFNHSLAGLS